MKKRIEDYSLKDKIWYVLQIARNINESTKRDFPNLCIASKCFDIFITILITLSIFSIILRSIPAVDSQYTNEFDIFEVFCLIIFSIEYLLRFVTCKADKKYSKSWGRIKWMLSVSAIIDFLAICPGLFMISNSCNLCSSKFDLRFMRGLRLLRLLRLTKYTQGFELIKNTLRNCGGQLWVTASCAFVLLIIAACAMYFAENEAQPDKFTTIPHSIWWAAMTLTTVGYGEIYPVTPTGKAITIFISFLGIGLFAIPAGIISANLKEILDERNRIILCPHCIEELQINIQGKSVVHLLETLEDIACPSCKKKFGLKKPKNKPPYDKGDFNE